jgi:hypothetical protein
MRLLCIIYGLERSGPTEEAFPCCWASPETVRRDRGDACMIDVEEQVHTMLLTDAE